MPKARLLVVEDEPNLLLGIRDILKLDGYEVITAQNGREALDALHAIDGQLPDLIVSDIMMPQLDGIELLEEVRKHDNWVTIPFIFLTAKGEKSDVQRGKIMGVDDYLTKPFDADDLLVAVDARLRRQQAINQVQAGAISTIKRNVLTILNHEFRTPLTLVVAYAEMLRDTSIEEMDENELLMFLREINSGADRLRHLIENFIVLVELETGDAYKTFCWRKQPIADLPLMVQSLCERVFKGGQPLRDYNLYLPESLPVFEADREYLNMILRELLDNAIKFSEPDQPVDVHIEASDHTVTVHVVDYGRGVPEEEQDKIWDNFYQVRREQFEDQGAGSGLAIVKGLVDVHKGQVGVDSRPGAGSRFTFTIPVQAAV
jgi:two-component system, sensor histidine kinase and response regulator